MNKITLFLLISLSLFSCDKSKEIPPEILENIIYESILADAVIGSLDDLSSKRPKLNYYEPIVKKYNYTIEDVKYTIEKMVQRKSGILGVVTINVKNRLDEKLTLYKKIYTTGNIWRGYMDEYILDTVYLNIKGLKIKEIKEIDSVYLNIPLSGPGRYRLSMIYDVGIKDKNKIRYLNGELKDSFIDGVSYNKFTKVIDAVGSRSIDHDFTVDNQFSGNTLSLNLAAKNSIYNNINDKNKTTKPAISVTEILLVKRPFEQDGNIRLYMYYTRMKFPTRIVEDEKLIYIKPPYRIKNNKTITPELTNL